MKKIILSAFIGLSFFLGVHSASAALPADAIIELRASATASNVNGGGFNPANANMLTDLTTDTNTGNTSTPVVSSASYNFVAGDVNAYVFIKAGTNWRPGWYLISSVASNKATLSAAIGAGMGYSGSGATRALALSTSAGVASVGTPTSGTFTIDYSQQDAGKVSNLSDGTSTASTTFISATAGFTPVMVGNYLHLVGGAGATVGWYEIVSYTNVTTIVLDRASGTMTLGNFYIGGAMSLNSTLDDDLFEIGIPNNIFYVKNGSYTTGEAVAVTTGIGTVSLDINYIGYNSNRVDKPTGTNRPFIDVAANTFTLGAATNLINLRFTATTTTGIRIGTGMARNVKVLNTSTTAGRPGLSTNNSNDAAFFNCEAISQNGNAINIDTSARAKIDTCYIHDSATGINLTNNTTSATAIVNNLIEANNTAGITSTGTISSHFFEGNTIYGTEAKMGICINLNVDNSIYNKIFNNIIYGCATGIVVLTTQENTNNGAYNDFFNNTTDVSLYNKDTTDIALDPQFTGATQITGTTATATGGTSTFTQSGGDFSTVTDNVDFLHITSHTSGTGTIDANYLITAHTSTTLTTNNAIGASGSITSINYFVTTGHNFAIGTNLKAQGFPGLFNGSETTGYLDIGAVQRQETSGSSGGSCTFVN